MLAGGCEPFCAAPHRSEDEHNISWFLRAGRGALDDRFRGVEGDRMVLFVARADMDARGLRDGDKVSALTATDDGVERRVDGLRVMEYPVPAGCIAGYYPECNPLIPLWHYAKDSYVPAAKSIAVRITKIQETS